MAEPVRHLKLVDDDGALVEGLPPYEVVAAERVEFQTQLEMANRELGGYRIRLARAEKEVRDLQIVEPQHVLIQEVADYWADRMLVAEVWKRRPTIGPGSEGWSKIRARLKDTPEPCTVPMLRWAVDGVLLSEFHTTKRSYLQAKSIFASRDRVLEHAERAISPEGENLAVLLQLPEEIRHLPQLQLNLLSERCDCGHLWIFHSKGDPARGGLQPCLHDRASCACEDYDPTDYVVDRIMTRLDRRAA